MGTNIKEQLIPPQSQESEEVSREEYRKAIFLVEMSTELAPER